jgi:hypothetical protein
MKRLLRKLQSVQNSRTGSVPVQYAIVAAGTAIVTMLIVQVTGKAVADKLNAVTSVLSKIQIQL